jgi:2-methylcitrate dehydratase PrpD
MENIKDPAILSLVHKTDYIANEALETKSAAAAPAIVTIKLKNGEVYKKRIDYAKGTINNPLKMDELKDKFSGLTHPALSSQKAKKIIEMLMNLEEIDNISRLIALLTVKKE